MMVMSGSYEYTGADGELYRVNWYADETGYHAEAEHLPRDGQPMISISIYDNIAMVLQTRPDTSYALIHTKFYNLSMCSVN